MIMSEGQTACDCIVCNISSDSNGRGGESPYAGFVMSSTVSCVNGFGATDVVPNRSREKDAGGSGFGENAGGLDRSGEGESDSLGPSRVT